MATFRTEESISFSVAINEPNEWKRREIAKSNQRRSSTDYWRNGHGCLGVKKRNWKIVRLLCSYLLDTVSCRGFFFLWFVYWKIGVKRSDFLTWKRWSNKGGVQGRKRLRKMYLYTAENVATNRTYRHAKNVLKGIDEIVDGFIDTLVSK